jgi:hypothetical protein
MLLLESGSARDCKTDGRKALLAVKAVRGQSSDAWRSVLDDLIGRGALPPRPSGSLTPNPTTPVRDHIRGAKSRRGRRQAVPVHGTVAR